MSDAITELRRLREWAESYRYMRSLGDAMAFIDARLAELEAQQAEPSDAEIEAWRKRATAVDMSVLPETHPGEFFQVSGHVVNEAIALMRRGRGDAKLREAAMACIDHSYMHHCDPEVSIPLGLFNALRAALGES